MIGILQTFNDAIFQIDQAVTYVLEKLEEADHVKLLEWISS